MYQHCPDCHRTYNDNHHSTVCPHRGIGFCAVCDCVICLCTNDGTCGDWERSLNAAQAEWLAQQNQPDQPNQPERTQPMDITSATTSATTPASTTSTTSTTTSTNPFIHEEGWPQTYGQPSTVTFTIQSGPIREHGVNGCQIDDVVAWAKEKIEGFNQAVPSRENSLVITKLDEALLWLMKRRLDREKRQVEGTSQR